MWHTLIHVIRSSLSPKDLVYTLYFMHQYTSTGMQTFKPIKHWFLYSPLIKLHSVLIYSYTMEWLGIVGWPWMIQISPWISHILCTNVWGMSIWECYNYCNIFMTLILEDHESNKFSQNKWVIWSRGVFTMHGYKTSLVWPHIFLTGVLSLLV